MLSEIPGIGPKKSKRLLTRMGSLESVRRATLEELVETSGLDQKTCEAIFSHFRELENFEQEQDR
ncbi:MAG: helix-hairpin-helix domain-containing protein [Bdellovibrionota bacterium]